MADASPKPRHLSVVSKTSDTKTTQLTRAQVADRLGASVSTVRRCEGAQLHPTVDDDGTHWFDPAEVTALAASRANQAIARGRIRPQGDEPEKRTPGEIAALVFERFEQRQSHAEIVIGLRIEPALVRELFDQWCLGLTEGQLRKREPRVSREQDIERSSVDGLKRRLAALAEGEFVRLSVGRWRGVYQAGEDDVDYAWIVALKLPRFRGRVGTNVHAASA